MSYGKRSPYPGNFEWADQVALILARDWGIARRPSPAELQPYALAGLGAGETARRHAVALGVVRPPRPEPPPAAPTPKQAKLFE